MGRLSYKWLLGGFLAVAWTAAWAILWRVFLLDALYRSPDTGVLVYDRTGGDVRILWITIAVAVVLLGFGASFVHLRDVFRYYSSAWSRFWFASGVLVIAMGLALPVAYPSSQSLVVDERERTVGLERHWLYATMGDKLAFEDIAKLNLRVERRSVSSGEACKTGLGFSIVAQDRSVIVVPKEFADRELAETIASVTGILLEERGRSDC